MSSVSALLLHPLLAALDHPEQLFRATDLTPELVADADARVSPAQFCVAWAEVARLSGDAHVALHIAERVPVGAFGVVEYVCRASATLGEALAQWVRYLHLLNDAVEVGVVEEEDHAGVRVLSDSEAPAPLSHELCFALLCKHARALASAPVRFESVRFSHRPAGDAAVYRRWFDAPVLFGADTTELVLPRAALGAPLSSADETLAGILARHADELDARDRSVPPLTAQVKRVLVSALSTNDAAMARVARKLGLAPRTLQRRLKDEGVSFQSVLTEVRHQMALRYLEGDMALSEIAFLLGFSEPSAFFRAFKRWTGTTALEIRAQLRAT